MLTPGALSGTTQVIDSFSPPGATGCRLPHQVSWQNTAAVPSIFRPLMVTPRSSSSTTRSVAGGRARPAPALRIGHGVGRENVVAAHVPVVVADVVAEARPDAIEHGGVHHQAAHIAREVVRRAAEQPVRPGRDAAMGLEAALQILARARQQEVGRKSFSVLLEGHDGAVLRRALAVVDHGEGSRRVAERRVGGDVLDHFAADIDATAVADAVEVFLAGHQHGLAHAPVKLMRYRATYSVSSPSPCGQGNRIWPSGLSLPREAGEGGRAKRGRVGDQFAPHGAPKKAPPDPPRYARRATLPFGAG